MRQKSISVIVSGLVLFSLFSCNLKQKSSNDSKESSVVNKIYEWRGPNRSGIYPDTHLLKSWPEGGPALVWEYDSVGNGFGSPVFTPDAMYILGEVDSLATVFAFDNSGNLLWKKDIGYEWTTNYMGSRSTPTVVNDLLYATTGLGNLCCLNRKTGEKLWSVDMLKDLHGHSPLFGFSESVVVDDSLVFCTPGGVDTNVVALNRFNGNIVWISKGEGERPGYNSPQLIKLANRHILVNFSAYHLMGHDTKTGQLLWTHLQDNTPPEKRQPGMGDTHGNTVLYENGFIYYVAGDGNGGVKLALSANGDSITEVWRDKQFDSFMGGVVKIGDYLYACSTEKPTFKSCNAETGKIGEVLKIGSGAVISADSMLYYYNHKGEVILLTSDTLNMEVKGKFKITKGEKEHFSHPVIHEGKLYIRHGMVIQAYNIKAQL